MKGGQEVAKSTNLPTEQWINAGSVRTNRVFAVAGTKRSHSAPAAGATRRYGKKPGTGNPLHTQELVTVASFRTWRGWRERVARDRYLTLSSLPSVAGTNVPFPSRPEWRRIDGLHARRQHQFVR